MVSVYITKSDDIIREITVSGHAEYTAAPGTDIVCAAISALTGSLILGLTEVVKRDDLDVSESNGYMHLIIPSSCDEMCEIKTAVLTNTYSHGMEEIEESYGDYLKIYYKNTEEIQ